MTTNEELKQRQQAIWATGDFSRIADRVAPVSLALLDEAGVATGQEVLDVACGTGNLAVPAAELGARVSGLDITPMQLEAARERAAAAGVEVALVEGDAEELPFEDDSFDRVLSVFGVMFAPDQASAASELVRVCRPGGRIGVCAWTPEGLIGRTFIQLVPHLPPPPPESSPPILWGVEDHVRGLFSAAGGELEAELRSVTFEGTSAEEWVAFDEENLGPVVTVKSRLAPEGRWEEVRAELVSLYEDANESEDGALRMRAEYLMSTLTLPG